MDIYVNNLNPGFREDDLRILFESYGYVSTARIIRDIETRRSKGFGFITMDNPYEGQRAIDDLHRRVVNGNELQVFEAKPKLAQEEPIKPKSYGHQYKGADGYTKRNNPRPQSYNYHVKPKSDERLPMEVKDEAEYSTKVRKDGLVKVSFKR